MTNKAQLEQAEALNDRAKTIQVGKYTYHVKALRNWQNWRISELLTQQKVNDENLETNIGLMQYYVKLHAKCSSIGLFKSYWLFLLFHWAYWRILLRRHGNEDTSKILSAIIEKTQVSFFFLNTTMIESLNKMMRKQTKKEVQSASSLEQSLA